MSDIIKDYCGTLNVKSIRANLFLVHELLDETMDYGVFQCLTTADLRPLVHYEPVVVHDIKEEVGFSPDAIFDLGLNFLNQMQISSNAATKPISVGQAKQMEQRNEIFIDIIEKLNVTVESDGQVVHAEIQGVIRLKSFLHGAPELKIMLNRDLFVGALPQGSSSKNGIVLNECSFHKCVNKELFSKERVLHINPPVGESVIFKYILADKLKNPLPFRMNIDVLVEEELKQITITLKLKCNVPSGKRCSGITVTLPFPFDVGSALVTDKTQTVSQASKRLVQWQLPYMDGGNEKHAAIKVKPAGEWPDHAGKCLGPISILFECQSYTCSDLKITSLKLTEKRQNYLPYKWARSVTYGNNYVFRM